MPDKNNLFFKYNWPAFSWALIILILCGIPGTELPKLSFFEWLKPDKVVHLIIFGVQSYLLIKGFIIQTKFPGLKKNAVVLSLLLTISYGAIVEILQDLVFIQRSGDIRDALANALGAFLGYWLYRRLNNSKTQVRV